MDIKSIETLLSEQRNSIQKEIERLQLELKKIDAMLSHAKHSDFSESKTHTIDVDMDVRTKESVRQSLTECIRQHIRSTLPSFGAQGCKVSEIVKSLPQNYICAGSKMVSTILYRMGKTGEIESYGNRRTMHWRIPKKNEAPNATTPGASKTTEEVFSSVNENQTVNSLVEPVVRNASHLKKGGGNVS